MRVLHTIAGLHESSGGPSRTTVILCEELAKIGVSVHMVTQRSRWLEGSYETPDRRLVATRFVDCYHVNRWRVAYGPRFRAVVQHTCEEQGIDIIHDHGMWLPTNRTAVRVARERNLPLVVSPRGMLEPRAFEHGAWKKRLAWTLYQKKDLTRARVLCATSTEEAQSIRGCGFQQPIAVVPNGVTLPKLKEGRNQRRIVRTMLFLSRIHPMKGLPLLVEAWKRAQPLGWRVLVVGPDESGHRETVEEAVSAADLKDVFEFVGPATEAKKARFFEIADVFVLPTMSENFGVVVAEALAHGVPVITTTGAPWRGLVENDCGWWVRPEVGELASAILEATALTDVERAAMGSRGRSWMERDFSWPSLAMRMRSVYEWVVSGGKTPDCMIEGHRAS